MRPGENCLGCHDGKHGEAPAFTVAGTVFDSASSPADAGAANVTVIITDANSAELRLTTNAAGNFYTSKTLALPLKQVALERGANTAQMISPPPNGGCSGCHNNPPASGAPGRINVRP